MSKIGFAPPSYSNFSRENDNPWDIGGNLFLDNILRDHHRIKVVVGLNYQCLTINAQLLVEIISQHSEGVDRNDLPTRSRRKSWLGLGESSPYGRTCLACES